MMYFFRCRLVRRTLVCHLPHVSLSPIPWRRTAITDCFILDWLDWCAALCRLHCSSLEANHLSKCVEAVHSLTMSIFLFRFVTSVTKKKKAFCRSVMDAWPFSPSSSAWSGALFCCWSLTSICTFSCLRNSGCLRCQGKAALCPAQSSNLAGLKKKKTVGRYTECLNAGDMREVGSDSLCCQRADQKL